MVKGQNPRLNFKKNEKDKKGVEKETATWLAEGE